MIDGFIPKRGDVLWISLHPRSGCEQYGRQPVLVLSPLAYNRKVGLALCCPVTSRVKGYPFEVRLPDGLPVAGVILADQLRSLDWRVRDYTLLFTVPVSVVDETLAKITLLLTADEGDSLSEK